MSDYISREALLERIDGIWDCNDMVFRPNDHCCTVPEDCKGCKWAETRDAIRRIVENIPAADVRPVVKASWEQVSVTYDTMEVEAVASMFCPKCKRYHNEVFFYGYPRENANYCPNCGAEMKEGET